MSMAAIVARALTTTTTTTRSFTTPSHSPSSILTSINSLLQSLHPNQNPHFPENPLNQFSHHLTPSFVLQVLKSQPNPNSALFFFHWASNPTPNPNHYSHTPPCYFALLDILLSHSLFSTSISFLQYNHLLSDFTVSKLIKAYGDHGDFRGAIHWLKHAKIIEFNRCLYSYNALLGVLVTANRIDLAKSFFHQMLQEGVVRPDVSTYTVMIKGYCKQGMIEDAKKVFDEMRCKPNLITCNTLLAGLCRQHDMKSAREIVNQMDQNSDSRCLPDTVTFTTLIGGYCKNNEMEEAMKCLDEMVGRNCVPNELTYNALINGLCLNGRVEEGKMMMTKMRLSGLKDNVATHTSLLKGYCISGKCDEAAKHLKEMTSLGFKMDEKVYAVVVNEYCKMRRPDEAIELLDEMKRSDIKPNVSSFNALFRVLSDLGEVDRAMHILKEMPERGCYPNFWSYSPIICCLCSVRGRMRDVEDLVVDMSRIGHRPDSTMYSSMVKGYCKDGDVNMAIHMFREMMEKGFLVNIESFLVFVKELCGKGKASEAKKLFEEMYRRCPVSNVDAYRNILNEHLCNLWADLPDYLSTTLK